MIKSDINKARWQVWDKHWIYTNELVRNQVTVRVWDHIRNQIRDKVNYQVRNQVWYQNRNQVRNQVWYQIWDDLRW